MVVDFLHLKGILIDWGSVICFRSHDDDVVSSSTHTQTQLPKLKEKLQKNYYYAACLLFTTSAQSLLLLWYQLGTQNCTQKPIKVLCEQKVHQWKGKRSVVLPLLIVVFQFVC